MFQFAAPIVLTALGALALPIAIHLVRRPLKTVMLGSLRFVSAHRVNMRSVRWRQRLLLALRCLVLTALACSLAGLTWHSDEPVPVRWLLVVPGTTPGELDTDADWRRLRDEGYSPRWFAAGFPAHSTGMPASTDKPDLWSLLREADARVGAGSRAFAFGSTSAMMFAGARPTLSRLEVAWHAPTSSPAVAADPARVATRVAVFAAANRQDDARYLRAAFTAIGDIEFSTESPDWVFQLGDAPVPASLTTRTGPARHLVVDARDEAEAASVRRTFDVGADQITLRRRVPAALGLPVLIDSVGETIVSHVREGMVQRWNYALRFHPDWSDWTISSAFPAWWRDQLRPKSPMVDAIGPKQATPSYSPAVAGAGTSLPAFESVDLRTACWLAALIAFLVERWLSRPFRPGSPTP